MTISLRQWMETRPTPLGLNAGRCVTLATDGLKIDKNNPLGIGFAPLVEGPPTYILVQGADANAAFPYTGVPVDEYQNDAVGEERFYELLREQLHGVEFFVSYSANYFISAWFRNHPLLQGLAGVPILDVIEYTKLLENNEGIQPTAADNWEDLIDRLKAPPTRGKGYSFPAVYNRVTGLAPVLEGEIFKGRLLDLKRLFGMLLIR